MTHDKISKIINLMSDGKPRTLKEIEKIVSSPCSSSVTHLYQTGVLWASDILCFMKAIAYKGGGRWKRPHGRQRWYLLPKEDERPPVNRNVTYEERDSTGRKNVTKTELMIFKAFGKKAKRVIVARDDETVTNILNQSTIALFPYEIANKIGLSNNRVECLLFRLINKKKPTVYKIGWRRSKDSDRTELKFRCGFLYYTKLDQVKARIADRDVLSGQKQALYERIRKTTEVNRQFTKLTDLAKEIGIYSKTIADYLDEVACVYTDLVKEDIAGLSYYYLKDVLAKEEIEDERKFAQTGKSEESSYKLALGKAHEDFCQFTIDQMITHGDFKVGDKCWWTEVVERNGKRRRRDIFLNSVDHSKRYEYDAILNVKTPVGKDPNILIWEMKYRGILQQDFFNRLIEKMTDTEQFSTSRLVKQSDGRYIKTQTGPTTAKTNITPVFVIPTTGKKSIQVGDRMMNFAEYVTSQGGKIVFTQEYERILEKYYPEKKVDFQRLFSDWWKQGSKRTDFNAFLNKYLNT